MAVAPSLHRGGVGRALLAHAEDRLAQRGVALLHVKTLGPSHANPHYARTRAFYESMGFVPLFETPKLWGPNNPALILVKAL